MLGRHRAAECHHLLGEIIDEFGRLSCLLLVLGEEIDVIVGVAHVSVDGVLSRKQLPASGSIVVIKFAMAGYGDGKVSAKLRLAGAPPAFEHRYRQRVPELSEALAIRSMKAKPGFFKRPVFG